MTFVRLGATSLVLALSITNVAADFAPSAASLDYGSGIYARALVALMLSSVVGFAVGSYWALTLAGAWCVLLLRLGEAKESGVSDDLAQYVITLVILALMGLLVGTAARRGVGRKRSTHSARQDPP